MKNIYRILAIAMATSLALVSCNKDKSKDEEGDADLVGTWTMDQESTHYFQVSFDAKGNFDWQILGVAEYRETGTYAKSGDVLTLTTKKFYDRWDDETGTQYTDKWIEKSMEYGPYSDFNGKRTVKLSTLKEGVLICSVSGDAFFGDEYLSKVYLFLVGGSQSLTASDLAGTWIYQNASGEEVAKCVFNGTSYSRKIYSEYEGKRSSVIWDDSGTWSYSKGIISFGGCEYEDLGNLRIYVDGNTMYLSNFLDFGFDVNGYTYTKQ